MDRNRLTVVCALIEHSDRLLVARRQSGTARAGKWEFPGGKIQAGESMETAIVREIEEELGCEIRPTARLATYDHAYPDLDIALVPFLCALVDGIPRALEHADIRWVNAAEYLSLDWAEADLPIATAYFSPKQ